MKEKIVVVTGAAGGIGEATVKEMLQEGAIVTGLDVDVDRGRQLAADVAGRGEFRFVGCDVAIAEEVELAIAGVITAHGRIDALCNVAGNTRGIMFDVVNTDEAGWDLVQAINLKSVYLVSRAVLPHMLERGSGSIINIASTAGMRGYADRAAYSAAKGGVISLTRAMATDYAGSGVRVNCISPGAIDTPAISKMVAELGPERLGFLEDVPMHRMGKAEEVARVIRFLASDESSYMAGAVVPVDGGLYGH